MPGRRQYHSYASIASTRNSTLKTSFRSAIHATLSTRSGCNENSAATAVLAPTRPVIRHNATHNTPDVTACSTTFVRWKPAGRIPNRLTSTR